MKTKHIAWLACAALVAAGCCPEDFDGVNEGGLPQAEGATVSVSVDDETNAVTLTMAGEGVYPLWYLPVDGKEITKNEVYATENPFTKIWVNAGDYTAYYRVGNRNGLSQGMGQVTFSIANTLVNYDNLLARLAGKEWRIASEEAGHLACGASGSDGTGWWSAAAGEKSAMGVYDDRLTFSNEYDYTYNPGTGGTVYVNTGVTLFPDYHKDEDFTVPVEEQAKTYSLSAEGEDIFMVLPAGTLFPYIPADGAYTGELRLRIESLTASRMVLVWDNGEIAWHYILTSASAGFQGFDATSDCNIFKGAEFTNKFFYAPNWVEIDAPAVTQSGRAYDVALPEATTDQWQAQVIFKSTLSTQSANNYDFSVKLTSTTEHPGVTVKLTKEGDDNTFYFVERVSLKAGEEKLFYKSDMPGLDIEGLNLVFDFGGNAANSTVTVSDFCLEVHGCDGIEAPTEDDEPAYEYDATTTCNLWNTVTYENEFYYAPEWVKIDDPELTADGNKYTVELPSATFQQWQAQVFFKTNIATASGSTYDFAVKLTSTTDITAATVKLCDVDSDDAFFFTDNVNLKADETLTFHKDAFNGLDISAVKLVFDFGGNPAETSVTIEDVYLKETSCE